MSDNTYYVQLACNWSSSRNSGFQPPHCGRRKHSIFSEKNQSNQSRADSAVPVPLQDRARSLRKQCRPDPATNLHCNSHRHHRPNRQCLLHLRQHIPRYNLSHQRRSNSPNFVPNRRHIRGYRNLLWRCKQPAKLLQPDHNNGRSSRLHHICISGRCDHHGRTICDHNPHRHSSRRLQRYHQVLLRDSAQRNFLHFCSSFPHSSQRRVFDNHPYDHNDRHHQRFTARRNLRLPARHRLGRSGIPYPLSASHA